MTRDLPAHLSRGGSLGPLMSRAVNNGVHSANAFAAMFIANDVLNVSHREAGIASPSIKHDGYAILQVRRAQEAQFLARQID